MCLSLADRLTRPAKFRVTRPENSVLLNSVLPVMAVVFLCERWALEALADPVRSARNHAAFSSRSGGWRGCYIYLSISVLGTTQTRLGSL